jgi:hypothetical protein
MWYYDQGAWVLQESMVSLTKVRSDQIPIFYLFGIDTDRNMITAPIMKSGRYAIMAESIDPTITNVVLYPNPFKTELKIGLEIGSQAELSLDIYTVAGRLVRTIKKRVADQIVEGNKKYVDFDYDGEDDKGNTIANGTYIYKITSKNGVRQYTKIGKLVKIE